MYIEELIPNINLETKNIEFKGIIGEGKSKNGKNFEIGWLKSVVAFANTEGGVIYIGVEDKTHKIVALTHEKADKAILLLHRLIKDKITPMISYSITPYAVPRTNPTRYVLAVEIKKNSNLPVTLHENGLLGIYIRNFGQTEIATSEQIRDLVLLSENIPYDRSFTEIKFDKNKFNKMLNYASDKGIDVTEKELISIGFMSKEKKLSEGALLFMDDCDNIITKTVATKWPGRDKGSDIVEASEDYVGNLLEIILKSTDFIKNHSNSGYRKVDNGREDYNSFPVRSITEGIVNAIGHRNYFISGTQIEINVYKDRLEIVSPGALLGIKELNKEKNIASIVPRRRNEVICAILSLLKLMERKGSGFDTIELEYSAYDEKYRPYISSNSNSFTLCLPDVTYAQGIIESEKDVSEVYVEGFVTGKNDMRILAYCYMYSKSVKEIAEYIGVTPSTYFRNNTIKRLCNEGYMVKLESEREKRFIANKNKVKLI